MINRAIVMGRLTSAPELRQTQSGVYVLSFTVAVDSKFANQNGERQTNFINCVAWRHTAEFISKYFVKGQMIGVEGSLQSRSFVDKNGSNRSVLELIVENASFCGSKSETTSARVKTASSAGGEKQISAQKPAFNGSAGFDQTGDGGFSTENGVQEGDSFSVGDLESVEGFEEIGTDDAELPF